MEKLCSGGLASSMKDVGKTVKSFPAKIVLMALLMLLCMLMPQKGWAAFQYETTTYDFLTAANTEGNIITMSETQYSDITEAFYGATMTYGNNTVDISKFAFKSGYSNGGWWLRGNNNGEEGLKPQKEGGLEFAICDLHAGDIVTITYSNTLSYARGAHIYNANSPGGVTSITSGTPYTVAQDGDLVLTCNNMYIYIQTITIQELTSVATYSITSNVNSSGVKENMFEFTGEGRLMDTHISIPFLDVEFGSNLNATFVHSIGDGKYGSYIPDEKGYWHTWFGEKAPYQGTFYKFKPTADGKLQVKGYLESGTVHLFEVVDEEAGSYESKGTSSGTGYVTVVNGTWVDLKKGKTYYICEQPNDGSRDNNNFQLHWFQFNNYFDVPELGKVLENGATGGELVTVKTNGLPGGTLNDWSVKRTSPNIKNKEESSDLQVTCTNGVVSISGIEYKDENKDKAGVMILDLNFSGGDATFVVTIPYSAEKRHIWNFYDTSQATNAGTGLLEIGQYKTTSSQLKQETDNGEWKYTYRVINNQGVGTHDPMYQNVYDMEGNNADKIWETEGLWFDTPPYKSCLYNENNLSATEYTDRYVGILPKGSFTIPGLKQGDRVLIQMGSGEGSNDDVCFFNISNALDAIGQPITSSDTYKAGGSLFNPSGKEDYALRGYYHFIAAADGPMTFYMNDGSMTKIYSIEIYTGTHKHTNDPERQADGSTVKYNGDSYTVSGYQYVHRYNNNNNLWGSYQMHYRGKGDPLRDPTVIYKSGNVTTTLSNLFWGTITNANGNTSHHIFFKSVKGEHGMFRMRVDVMEQNKKYVADYGLQNICVGYIDKQVYPYTWDFTDLMKYSYTDSNDLIKKERSTCEAYNKPEEFMDYTMTESGGFPADQADVKAIDQWKWYNAEKNQPAGYGLQVRNSGFNGELAYPSESQLYAGNDFIAEAVGIDIKPFTTLDSKRNGHLRITDQGLSLYQRGDKEFWSIKIPEVSTDAAVYVRAKSITQTRTPRWDASTVTYSGQSNDGDYIFAVKGTGGDVVIKIGDAIIQKIAVSTDAKTVNKLGYATESRAKEIDPELMGYMTGTGLKAYTVTNVTYGNKAGDVPSITLTEIPSANVMGPAGTNDHKGYIIYNTGDTKEVNILDNGFHLFVPDMHDISSASNHKKSILETETEEGKNYLRSHTNSGNISQTEKIGGVEYTNYLMNYKYIGPDNKQHEGPEAFYRASSTATLGNNKAYLQLLTEKVKPSEANGNSGAKFAIIFVDEEQGTETTALDGVKSVETMGDNAIYTLSGVKVSKPEKGGIYVKNGKKFIAK